MLKVNIIDVLKKYKNITIITGGTFGHINPSIALSLKYNIPIYIESKLTKYYIGIKYKTFTFTSKWNIIQLFKALFFFIKEFKQFDTIFLSGAYVCLPAFLAAFIMRKKILIHEQNSIMGRANKIFSYFATEILTSFCNMPSENKKYICTGFFISKPKFKKANKHIAIISGTNSSSFLDLHLTHIVAKFAQKHKLMVYHQAHDSTIDKVVNTYKEFKVKSKVQVKFNDFEKIIAESKILINRAGAGSIAYALLYQKNPILIPLSWSKDDHQKINAIKSGLTFIEEKNINNFEKILEKNYKENIDNDTNKVNHYGDFYIDIL